MKLSPADLRQVDVLKDAPQEDLEILVRNGILRAFEDGEYVFFQGDSAAFLYILTGGRVKLLQSNAAGQQVNLRTINAWEMFGAIGVVRPLAEYPATAQAIEPSSALAIESTFLKGMLPTRPYLNTGLMRLMTGYIMEMQVRYRELATERVERRLALTILRLAGQIGRRTEANKLAVEIPLSRQEIAEAAGTTLYTVSRVLADWERRGLVQAGRERVVIRNPHGLVQISEGVES